MNAPATSPMAPAAPLLRVTDLVRHYTLPRTSLLQAPGSVQALRGVSLQIEPGRSLGLVGESGSGKSTLARLVMALDTPTSGAIELLGQDLSALSATELRATRRHFQMVFQDPYGSLDPRLSVERIVTEPLRAQGERDRTLLRERAANALEQVGLRRTDLDKVPHEFSGGQRQRVAIARALITRPKLIVADEPVSALDVSVQAQVLNLLQDLREQFGISYLLISHDLAVVQHVCEDVAVLWQGQIVERGPTERIFADPQHPYTQSLLAAALH
jgi:ABC-type glutathione transport system ATPase component